MTAVVITTYNHAAFLASAIESCQEQSWHASEIVVVDDGSTDDPGAVVAAYAGVRIVRQANQGLAAARNTGLRETTADTIIFLDADDRLLSTAIETGVKTLRGAPDAVLSFGAYRYIDSDGEIISSKLKSSLKPEPYLQFLRQGNIIGMHATVMYRRDSLVTIGGFDAALRACEDYDVFLRLSRNGRIVEHDALVAEYRRHGNNMSLNRPYMVDYAMRVLDKQVRPDNPPEEVAAISAGRRFVLKHYAGALAKDGLLELRRKQTRKAASMMLQSIRMDPAAAFKKLGSSVTGKLQRSIPAMIGRATGLATYGAPALGKVTFGDFARTEPISRQFGFDRGLPVDRYYIERVLSQWSADIHGRVLEIGDNEYTMRFGGGRVEKSDVLHVKPGNPIATIVGDLSEPGVLPEEAFDCIVLTQTLHLIFDMPKAVAALHRSLKVGGVLLVTVPGITPVDRDEWGSTWYWSLTLAALRRLLGLSFKANGIDAVCLGNVFAACSFLQGLAVEEVPREKLDLEDRAFPVIVAARATRLRAA